jgi:hypothetical protein
MHSVEKDKDLLQYLWNYLDLLQYLRSEEFHLVVVFLLVLAEW